MPYSSPPGQPSLPAPVLAAASGQLSYNDLSKQLSYAGVLTSAAQAVIDAVITVNTTDSTDSVPASAAVTFTPASMANIYPGVALLIDTGPAQEIVIVAGITAASFTASTLNAHDGTGAPFPIVNDPALADGIARLTAASQQAVAPFFATYPELRPLYDAYMASTDPVPARRTALLAAFLPVLKTSRKQEQALASVTSAAGSDPSFASELLHGAAIMHADAGATAAAVTDLTAIEQQGLSARFFLGNDPAAPADLTTDSVPLLSYSPTATVGGAITAGDTLTTTINGVDVPYQAGPADTTLAQLAGNIAAAINQATVLDPGTGLPIGRVVAATASGSVITITGTDPSGAHAYFTLAVRVSTGATETYTPGSQLPAGTGGGPIAGIWSGYVTAAQDGDYDISVVTRTRARRSPSRSAVSRYLARQAGSLWQNQGPVSLVAGQLIPVTLTATSLHDHALGQLAEHRPRLAAHPGPVPVLRHAGHPAERYLHPVPQGHLPRGQPVPDRGGTRVPRDIPAGQPPAASWLNVLTAAGRPGPGHGRQPVRRAERTCSTSPGSSWPCPRATSACWPCSRSGCPAARASSPRC